MNTNSFFGRLFHICWSLLLVMVLPFTLAGCKANASEAEETGRLYDMDDSKKTYQDLVVGFAQVGAESDWRTANTISIKEMAEELNIELKFMDAQQKHENQVVAVRTLIAEKVDIIGISPVVETGWTEVFEEAKEAGIPIILVDRGANVSEDLYVTLLGSDFVEEGRKSARILVKLMDGDANIVQIMGNMGSGPTIGRDKGFREVLEEYPDMKIIDSKAGDFTYARGREAMQYFLNMYGSNIDAVFAQNDDMALGAIEAIEDYGLEPGVDIKIVSVDAARRAFEAMIDGKLNATVECNPLLGSQFFEIALKVVNGEPVAKRVYSKEDVFFPEDAEDILPTRKY